MICLFLYYTPLREKGTPQGELVGDLTRGLGDIWEEDVNKGIAFGVTPKDQGKPEQRGRSSAISTSNASSSGPSRQSSAPSSRGGASSASSSQVC